MDALFQTGYPHPINLFVALMLGLLPVLGPLAGTTAGAVRPGPYYLLAGGVAWGTLLVWSRLRVANPARSNRYYQVYLALQTVAVSLIYVLDGGLTRFLFVVVAVQAVYLNPVRRWAWFLGTVGALWLTLYLVLSPGDPGANKVAVIGMYLCYLIFAALVTFTTVQQERQVQLAHDLLEGVDERHQALRAYDLSVEQLAKMEERERLAQTIYAELQKRLASLQDHLNRLLANDLQGVRFARLEAKEVLASVREAVRTLRPGEDRLVDEEEGAFEAPPSPEISVKVADPLRIYHVWNVGVIVVTTGVIVASDLVGGTSRWLPLLGMGLALLGAYAGAATARQPWNRTLYLVLQTAICLGITFISTEPLMNHLLLIVAAQIVFLVPMRNRWPVAAGLFPTVLSALVLAVTNVFKGDMGLLFSWSGAFGVTYFFGALMAYMTRRQVEARQQAILYAQQMAQVNNLLEAKLHEVRRMVVAQERVRMAREIHDSLGHHLTTIIVELQSAEALAEEDPAEAANRVRSAQGIISAALVSSGEMLQSLERFDRPLPAALKELVLAWRRGNGADVSIQVTGDCATLSTSVGITLYRVVQESLTNIQKHARARRVEIVLVRQPDRVMLTVTNDSSGTPPRVESASGGFGLVGLRERADALQGEFSTAADVAGGFQVKVVLPLGA